MGADATEVFEQHRPFLEGVAYRMLGRVADAEDVVQEAWLRWSAADRGEVREPRAYLVRITTRLAVDRLRQIQARHEAYVGPWLPEPLVTDTRAEPVPEGADRALLSESVSLALLVVMESLSPLERAVFVLREAFGFPHAEIAAALGRSESAVRQLAGRARRHVDERKPRYEVNARQQRDLTERFLEAALGGDLGGLLDVLAPDARLVADSGGRVKAPRRVMHTADKIGRFMAAIAEEGRDPRFTYTMQEINGVPAVLASWEGEPYGTILVDVADGRIQTVYIINNPSKVARLAVSEPS
ncbi:RNA polymerase sigma-70 factor [Streptomyces boncukensis]|uniref:RNA polymerase sigma-70 factor n=1 Tax=Streptomyces boncukensis TaxID=2711219 RepID=A0A6G4WTM7_9ACTN|nr:RNA polymerase sigma-70 factor [Streptomyces boncukensis]